MRRDPFYVYVFKKFVTCQKGRAFGISVEEGYERISFQGAPLGALRLIPDGPTGRRLDHDVDSEFL
jgi:hypothetical protein